MNHFYKYLKNYKDLNNFQIKGKIIRKEKLEDRKVLINFYNEDLLLNYNINYFPIYQSYFLWKDFIAENLLKEHQVNYLDENKNDFDIKNHKVLLKMTNSNIILSDNLWEKYWNSLKINTIVKNFKHLFKNIDIESKYYILKNKKKIFYNRNIRSQINDYRYGVTFFRLFLKQFLRNNLIFLLISLKKSKWNKLIGAPIKKISKKGLKFYLPGLKSNEQFFLPFRFLFYRKKFNISKFKVNLKNSLESFFFFKIHSIKKKNNSLIFTVKLFKNK